MKIILCGGGTGGHIMPNLALAKTLKEKEKKVETLYVGSKKGMDREIVEKEGLKFVGISCGKLRRYFSLENFLDFFKNIAGIFQSIGIVRKFKPQIIFSKGGYVSLPMVIAGWMMRVPVLTHESDLRPGLATRLASGFCVKVLVSFEKTLSYFKKGRAVFCGSPIRSELANGSKEKALEISGLKGYKKIILIMGGSQGAASINEWVWKNIDLLTNEFEILHLTGKGKINEQIKNKSYYQQEFAGEEMKDFYAAAGLVICRAGANSLFELQFLKKPSILIPLQKGSRGDQVDNAEEYIKHNTATVISEEKLEKTTTETLLKRFRELIHTEKKFQSQLANEQIVDLIFEYAKKN